MLGLDNAGKTTIVRRLTDQPIDEIEPTLGFSIQTLDYDLRCNDNESTSGEAAADTASDDANENTNTNTNDGTDTIDNDYNSSTCMSSTFYKLHLWDIGGQSTIRAYWRNYFEKTDGIIWVVDSGDRRRLSLVRDELQTVLKQERLAGASLLVMANKNDLQGSLSVDDIAGANGLRLEKELLKGQTHTRHWTIQGCSAVTGEGLSEGIEWLVRDITNRIYFAG